jgi:hypothetical protein
LARPNDNSVSWDIFISAPSAPRCDSFLPQRQRTQRGPAKKACGGCGNFVEVSMEIRGKNYKNPLTVSQKMIKNIRLRI